ncbi:hypothetical protein [Roseivivax marinus]|uniref:hypothetical protein n=1 Tax=Roseivivax marinus TaxID=1379903 RepID=UPI00273D1A7B|nr:hypothetical protein [Roseivivax marinus]
MVKRYVSTAVLGSGLLLSACVEETSAPVQPRAVPGDSLEGQARSACAAAVQRETGNPDVRVQSSSFSEAGTEVILRVGPTGTWRCIGYRDGTTAGIMSMTDEGAL